MKVKVEDERRCDKFDIWGGGREMDSQEPRQCRSRRGVVAKRTRKLDGSTPDRTNEACRGEAVRRRKMGGEWDSR